MIRDDGLVETVPEELRYLFVDSNPRGPEKLSALKKNIKKQFPVWLAFVKQRKLASVVCGLFSLCVCLYVCRSAYPHTCVSVHISVFLYPSICWFVCLCVGSDLKEAVMALLVLF